MTDELMRALADCGSWVGRFTRQGYEDAFRDYREAYGPAYAAAVSAVGEAGLQDLADALLDAIDAMWERIRFWDRARARSETKQVVAVYLSPMLLEDPATEPFARILRDRWEARWPKDGYHIAGSQRIQSGFKLKILGFEVPERKRAAEPEDE